MAFSTTMADNSLHKPKNLPEDIWVSQSNQDTSNDTNNVTEEAVFMTLVAKRGQRQWVRKRSKATRYKAFTAFLINHTVPLDVLSTCALLIVAWN